MAKWVMVIDLEKCAACQACVIACKMENSTAVGKFWRKVISFNKGEFPNTKTKIVPRPCMMCENAPCEKVCPVSATYHAEDGTVQINYDRCVGCKYCMAACPYGARQFNPEKQEGQQYDNPDVQARPRGVVEKCTFCAHRRAKYYDRYKTTDGFMTACAQICAAGATIFGDADDPESQVARIIKSGKAVQLRAEMGTKPRVYYLIA